MAVLPPGEGINPEIKVGVTYKLVIDQSKFFKPGGLAFGQNERYDAVSTDHAYVTPIGKSHTTGVTLFEVGYRVYWKEKWIQRGASPADGAVLETEGPYKGRWYDDIVRQVTLKEFQEKNLQVAGEIPYQSFFNPDKRTVDPEELTSDDVLETREEDVRKIEVNPGKVKVFIMDKLGRRSEIEVDASETKNGYEDFLGSEPATGEGVPAIRNPEKRLDYDKKEWVFTIPDDVTRYLGRKFGEGIDIVVKDFPDVSRGYAFYRVMRNGLTVGGLQLGSRTNYARFDGKEFPTSEWKVMYYGKKQV